MRENRSYFAALIIVALAAPVAALLFVVALVMWLAELMGSLVYPCLILGLFFRKTNFCLYLPNFGPKILTGTVNV